MEKKKFLGRCSERVSGEGRYSSFHLHQCAFKATVERNGKLYCTQHDPVYKEKKRQVDDIRWRKECQLHQEKVSRQKYSVKYCENLTIEELERRVKLGEKVTIN